MEALLIETNSNMDQVIADYQQLINKIRTGRANPSILQDVKISCYGDIQPLKSLAAIKVPEAKQILITPYDHGTTKIIAEAIINQNIQVQVQADANSIRLIFPDLTEESRKALTKHLSKITEEFRVKIRNCRRDTLHKLKALSLSDDNEKKFEQELQKITNKKIELVNQIDKEKTAELMRI